MTEDGGIVRERESQRDHLERGNSRTYSMNTSGVFPRRWSSSTSRPYSRADATIPSAPIATYSPACRRSSAACCRRHSRAGSGAGSSATAARALSSTSRRSRRRSTSELSSPIHVSGRHADTSGTVGASSSSGSGSAAATDSASRHSPTHTAARRTQRECRARHAPTVGQFARVRLALASGLRIWRRSSMMRPLPFGRHSCRWRPGDYRGTSDPPSRNLPDLSR